MRRPATFAALALAALAACESVPDAVEITETGKAVGFAFLDRNGSGALDAGDRPYRNLSISLVSLGSGSVAATVTTDSTGAYRFEDVPVGRYRLRVDAAQLGDSVQVTSGQDSAVTVAFSDSLAPQVRVSLSYPLRTIAQVRALAAGVPVLFAARVVGVVGDTVFFWDGSRGIRAPKAVLGAPLLGGLAGDSVRVVARTARAGTLPVLDSASIFPLADLPVPTPPALGSSASAGAGGGAYDAAAVRIAAATVLDSVFAAGVGYLRVDDGSGPVDVRLGAGVHFTGLPYTPGKVLNVSGLLLPGAAAGTWVVVPRESADLEITTLTSPFAPAIPTGVTATAVDSLVTLSWTDASSNETSFEVQRRGGGTPFFGLVATPGPNVQSIADSAAGNAFYGYLVRACNRLVCSAYTTEVTVATVPAAPTQLQVVARSLGLDLGWRDLSRVETRFEIQRKDGGGTFVDRAQTGGDVVTYRDEPLAAGTPQTYRVRACNAAGCSEYSNEATGTPNP